MISVALWLGCALHPPASEIGSEATLLFPTFRGTQTDPNAPLLRDEALGTLNNMICAPQKCESQRHPNLYWK